MKKYSLWLENIECEKLDSIEKDMCVDVAIVGGGIAGLSTLYNLRKSKKRCILLESDICGLGVTSKSIAKITPFQGETISNIRKYDKEKARRYFKSQVYAKDILVDTIIREGIDCDLESSVSYTFTNDTKGMTLLENDKNFFETMGLDVRTSLNELDMPNSDCIKYLGAYVFHPLKYINGLKEILRDKIYEQSRVEKIIKDDEGYMLYVNDCKVKARCVVIATHYPYFFKSFFLPLKSYVEVSYVGAKENKYRRYNAINVDKPVISRRCHRDKKKSYRIDLFKSFKTADIASIEDNFKSLVDANESEYLWSNNDIITNDYIPYIGCIKKGDKSFLIATGFNTWGMTNGTLAGKILADIIEGVKNPWIDLFDPNRKFNLSKLIRFPLDLFSNVKAFVKGGSNNVNNLDVEYSTIDGIRVASVKDSKGVVHTVLAKCPHMGCGILYNKQEETWDCMCHGSRFDLDGKVIEGPSNCDIRFKK